MFYFLKPRYKINPKSFLFKRADYAQQTLLSTSSSPEVSLHTFFNKEHSISNTKLRFHCDFGAYLENTGQFICCSNGNERTHFEMHFYGII